jgi:3-deoxy-D-manno-octulosonic acid kinase
VVPVVQELSIKNQKIWFDEELLSVDPTSCFDPNYWHSENNIIGSATGRGTTWFVKLESVKGALRHYRRGGLFGKLVSDNYLFSSWEKTRSFQEFNLLKHLQREGVNVPKPIAARAVKTGLTYRADILSELVPHASDLVDILMVRELSEQEYLTIGKQIRAMHDAGVNHTDLNIHNLLLDDKGLVWIIDFDKCALGATETTKQANLERLLRSFEKERIKRSIRWNKKSWQVILNGYSHNL